MDGLHWPAYWALAWAALGTLLPWLFPWLWGVPPPTFSCLPPFVSSEGAQSRTVGPSSPISLFTCSRTLLCSPRLAIQVGPTLGHQLMPSVAGLGHGGLILTEVTPVS